MKNFAYICSAEQSDKDITNIQQRHIRASFSCSSKPYSGLFCKTIGKRRPFLLPQVAKITSMQNSVITSNRVNNSSFVASIRTILCALGVLMLLTLPALGDSSPRIIFGWLAASAALILAGKGFSFQHINR